MAERSALQRRDVAPLIGESVQTASDALAFLADAASARRRSATSVTATSAEYAAFLFTDVVGSTSLVYAIGDDAWRHLRGWHDRTMRTVFAVHGGEEIDNAGDGFFVAFAVPDAAISCAVDIQRTLARHRVEHGFAPQVRIGVHAGRAARLDARFTGQAVVTAARIGSTAGGGEILVSRSTVAETPGVAWFEPRLVQLTGIVDPVEVVSVSWD